MKNIDWTNVEETQEFETVKPGGYVGVIYTAEDNPDKEYLKLSIDIAEGQFKDYYKELAENRDFWGLTLYRSYKDSAKSFFKSFYRAVEKSNPGYVWTNDETTLPDKLIGIILQEEEYIKNDGSESTRIIINRVVPVDDIRNGNFKVPEKKYLEKKVEAPKVTGNEDFMQVSGSANPFNS